MPDKQFAECDACHKEMAPGNGCIFTHLLLKNGSYVPRIRFGDRGEYTDQGCGDCNVTAGQQHHPGCDLAVCPICHGQESFCDCPIESYGVRE